MYLQRPPKPPTRQKSKRNVTWFSWMVSETKVWMWYVTTQRCNCILHMHGPITLSILTHTYTTCAIVHLEWNTNKNNVSSTKTITWSKTKNDVKNDEISWNGKGIVRIFIMMTDTWLLSRWFAGLVFDVCGVFRCFSCVSF